MFVQAYPAWTDAEGYPKSWRHYIVGVKRLNHARAQQSLDMFRASLNAQLKPEDRKPWIEDQERLAGYRDI